jgi:hypothetical protein
MEQAPGGVGKSSFGNNEIEADYVGFSARTQRRITALPLISA